MNMKINFILILDLQLELTIHWIRKDDYDSTLIRLL